MDELSIGELLIATFVILMFSVGFGLYIYLQWKRIQRSRKKDK